MDLVNIYTFLRIFFCKLPWKIDKYILLNGLKGVLQINILMEFFNTFFNNNNIIKCLDCHKKINKMRF